MTTLIQTSDETYETASNERLLEVIRNARAAIRQNHNDEEALKAIKDANDELNRRDQAEVAASPAQPSTGESIIEGFKGLGDLAGGLVSGTARMAKERAMGMIERPWEALLPITPSQMTQAAEGVAETFRRGGSVASRALSGEAVSPREASSTAGGLALLAAPFARGRTPPRGVGAEQFGGPSVTSGPTGATPPIRAPLPEPPITGSARVAQQAEAAVERAMRDPTSTPKPSGAEPFKPSAADAALAERFGVTQRPFGLTAEGPPVKPVTPAMEAFSEVRTGSRMRPRGSGGTKQKALTFGEESPLGPAARAEIKNLVGQISRGGKPMGPTEMLSGEGGFLGTGSRWFTWQLLNQFARPRVKAILEAVGQDVIRARMGALPSVEALEQALIQAYANGDQAKAQQIADQLLAELLGQD